MVREINDPLLFRLSQSWGEGDIGAVPAQQGNAGACSSKTQRSVVNTWWWPERACTATVARGRGDDSRIWGGEDEVAARVATAMLRVGADSRCARWCVNE
ncbi:hypothetical protein E2542_SST29521 [Spatholobus suberectus]|nr:hypothetical protein E2542_SST29521 [Spatholobus suberectus]